MKVIVILLILSQSAMAFAGAATTLIENTGTALPSKSADTGQTDTKPSAEKYPSFDTLFVRYQPYLENISAYKPMYFLLGTELEESKFQISFKYQLFNTESSLAERIPMFKGIHFAYTQTSFWDLASASEPFEETSYKPEFFYISPNIHADFSSIKGLFIQTGLQHESNGLAGEDSRSTNFLYVQPILIFYKEINRTGLAFGPKVWAYIDNNDETNRDLKNYRGYFDLEAKLGKEDGFLLASSFRWAKKGGSIQTDLTYPLHRLFSDILGIYLNVQYVSTIAENLLHYDERTEALRIGLAIVR
jgi:phospholipase A1